MGYEGNLGIYRLGRTIGEGTYAKVKVALNTQTGQNVAIKIIDKNMVMEKKLVDQVQREISTMKLLHHPNIVRIYEVIATRTKIFLVMEYVSGGQLADKLSYLNKLSEEDARKYFQQLIDALEYCHCRGVYHRDLKPENLLLDNQGKLKVSDFGFSVLQKPGGLLSTACGSPSYVAPEVIAHKNYEGAPADIWSCGVILFELLTGHLPFDDRNMLNLYRKISRADYTCPKWFTASQRKLIFRLLEPMPRRRMTIAEILEDEWFRTGYQPSTGIQNEENKNLDDDTEGNATDTTKSSSRSFINAFQLIAMSSDLDLSGLFEEQNNDRPKAKFGSLHSITETIEKIEVAAKDVSLSVKRMNTCKMEIHQIKNQTRSRSHVRLSAEVIEVTPTHCMVEISKSAGEIRVYKEFCKSLSSVLKEKSGSSSKLQQPVTDCGNLEDYKSSGKSKDYARIDKELRGYVSS